MGFKERMFKAGEEVYASIERGEMTDPEAVEVALMEAHFEASAVVDDEPTDQK